jgi:import inner membrane translocase subunit TIM50
MFAILSRSVPRRAISHTVRCMSQKPPPPPGSLEKEPEISESPPEPSPPTWGVPSLDFSPTEPAEERQRTGAKSSKDSLSSVERKRRVMGRVSLGVLVLAFGLNAVYMGREWDAAELKSRKMVRAMQIRSRKETEWTTIQTIEDAPSTRWARTKVRFTELFDVRIQNTYILYESYEQDLYSISTNLHGRSYSHHPILHHTKSLIH